MSNNEMIEKDDGLEVARRMAEEEEGIGLQNMSSPLLR